MADDSIITDFQPVGEVMDDFVPVAEAAPEPETDSWAEVIGGSVMQGLTFVPTSVGALSRFTNDLLGLDFLNRPGDLYDISKEAGRFWEPKTEGDEAKRHTANIIRTVGEMGSAAAMAIPTGGTAALLPTIAVGAGAQKFAEARAEGTEFTTAASAGLLQGEIEFLTEKAPLGILLKPGLSFGRRLAMGLVTDIPGELMATAGEMSIVDTQYLGKRYTLDQYLQALKDTAITAAGVTGGMTAITHPFVKQVEEFQEQVKKEPEKYEEIFTGGIKAMAEESPATETADLTEADVVDFRPEPIQDLTPEEAAMVEESTIETDEATERAVTELISEGVELDAITDDAIQAKIESFEQAPVSPVDETGVSGEGVEGEARATSFVGSDRPIMKAVSEQLSSAGVPESDIQMPAALWDSFFRTMGQRAGIDPVELFQRYKVNITRGVLTDAVRQGKSDIKTLADFVRDIGGISAQDEFMKGEVRDRFSIKGGFNLVNNKTGLTLDRLAEAAWEEGYFADERPTVAEFLDTLREDVDARTNKTGTAVFSSKDVDAAMEAELDLEYAKYLGQFEQSAYHGTPHKFDKFTLDHIGKGEGAQAYGWGLYFAENKDVAEWYKDKLTDETNTPPRRFFKEEELKIGSPEYHAGTLLETTGRTLAGVKKEVTGWIEKARPDEDIARYEAILAILNKADKKSDFTRKKPKGRLYKVNLTPEKDEYLDWDKPLSEQSEKVRAVLESIRKNPPQGVDKYEWLKAFFDAEWISNVTENRQAGQFIYHAIADNLGSPQAASLYLKSIGIPGIKYLEGASRGKGEGHHNFVIFDEELIEIEEFEQATRGRITFRPESVNIELLKDADKSTFLHETGHFYLKVLGDLAREKGAAADIKADFKTILNWFKVDSADKIETRHHEKFARGFEKYLAEGKAPNAELKTVFEQFKEWLIEVYKNLKNLRVSLNPEVRKVMDRLLATKEEIEAASRTEQVVGQAAGLKSTLPTQAVKGQVRRATGIQRAVKLIREDVALRAAWKKAEQNARIAFREGKKEEAAKWRGKMVEVLAEAKERAAAKIAKIRTEKQKIAARRKQINDIVEWLGLNDSQVKKLVKKDIRLMTDFEFMKFKNDLLVKAEEMQEKAFEKARLREIIESKRLQKVENYRRVLGYPTIDGMTTEQLRDFADTLEEFQDGDVFLTQRELEVVDRTDLKGIKTWREAKEALAKELETTPDKLDTIKPSNFDMMKWDASLAEQNPFYGLLVETTTKHLMNAEARYHEIENRIFGLARKSEKSRKRTLTEKLIPQDKQIFEYLEAPADMKAALAEQMTPEQLDLAHYMQEYFGKALEYLIKTKSLEKGRENYFVHMRRSFLETFKEDGLVSAVLSVFRNYQQDEVVFNILDDDTGNILPLEKFFQFSMRRTGALEPTQNVVKAFLTYTKTFEKKVTLDEIIPKLDIYAQSLTPQTLTPRGLETDRSLKKFVNRYINNKKGRQISFDSFIKQGGPIDLSIRAIRTFTTMMDLGLSIPVGVAAFVGERVANFQLLGAKGFALGEKRARTDKGKAILKKYEHFTGRSVWEEFTAPGKEVTERLMQGMFGLFHQATVSANKQFLLGMMTEEEFKKGEISEDRLTELKIEMGRWRVVPGAKSIIGSTSVGGAAVQYKSWAVVMARTTVKDLTTLLGDLKNKPTGEALTTKEARELYRAVGLISAVLIVSGAGDDEDDKSFTGQMLRRIRNESLSILSAISPDMWLATPRIIGFMTQLGKNLAAIIKLEEYKTKPGLKGVGGLKRQLTPGTVRQLTTADDNGPRARVQ